MQLVWGTAVNVPRSVLRLTMDGAQQRWCKCLKASSHAFVGECPGSRRNCVPHTASAKTSVVKAWLCKAFTTSTCAARRRRCAMDFRLWRAFDGNLTITSGGICRQRRTWRYLQADRRLASFRQSAIPIHDGHLQSRGPLGAT